MPRTFITPLGTVAWSAVVTPRLNDNNGRHEWVLGLIVDEAKAADILGYIEELKADAVAKDRSLAAGEWHLPIKPSMNKLPDGSKVPEPGRIVLSAKRNTERTKAGQVFRNSPPAIFDAMGQLATNISSIPPRSLVKATIRPFFWAKAGKKGISIDLERVQIGRLNEDVPDFEPIDDSELDGPIGASSPAYSAPPPVAAYQQPHVAPTPAYAAPQQPAAW